MDKTKLIAGAKFAGSVIAAIIAYRVIVSLVGAKLPQAAQDALKKYGP